MGKFYIESGSRTPKISFDSDTHYFLIEGKSLPENTQQFYESPISWIKNYKPEAGTTILLDMKFAYLNSSSLIALLSIVLNLKKHTNRNCTLNIKWFYEEDDEDLLLAGEDISDVAEIEFEYIEILE